MKKHTGLTLIETMAVMVIIAILSSLGGQAYGSMVLDGNIQTASTALQTYGSNVEDGIFNLGYLTELDEDSITQYLYQLEHDYLNCSFDYDTLTQVTGTDQNGFTIATKLETDPWGNPYTFHYLLGVDDVVQMMIASAGSDGVWSERVIAHYADGDYGDDLVLIMIPR